MTRILAILTALVVLLLVTRRRPKVAGPVYVMRHFGPISQEDVDDCYGGVVPEGRWVLGPNWAPGV